MDNNQVIVRPLLTEKTNDQRTTLDKYSFVVHPSANKIMVKQAIERLFDVKVDKCNIINAKGKGFRTRFGSGYRSDWKKAVVTLKQPKAGDKFKASLDFYEGI